MIQQELGCWEFHDIVINIEKNVIYSLLEINWG